MQAPARPDNRRDFIEGAVHLPNATPEQRALLRELCDRMEFPLKDCAPPPKANGRELVSFPVELEEMPEILDLARRCGISKTAMSRMCWRIGSYFLVWQNSRIR